MLFKAKRSKFISCLKLSKGYTLFSSMLLGTTKTILALLQL